jgi:VIT1/CCC1 family predicted Fe2+/Mn2+ transporter
VLAVFFLLLPYLSLKNAFVCLSFAMAIAMLIIAFFNYYVSVAKDVPFKKRFLEIAGISFGVAAVSFFIGFLLRFFLNVDI